MTSGSNDFIMNRAACQRFGGVARSARFYCIIFFLVPVVVAAAVAGVNIAVDSQALYWVRHVDEGSSRVRKFVDAMIAAPYGVYVPSCCQRLIKLELTRRLTTTECFVLGSSHQMQLRGNIGGRCQHTANLAVYGGAYEDLVTLLYAAIESGSSKTIFVGVDPWDLRRNADDRWHEFAATYARARATFGLKALGGDSSGFDSRRLANLLNLDYARANIDALLKPATVDMSIQLQPSVATKDAVDTRLLSDGTLLYEQSYVDSAPARRANFGVGGAFKIDRPWYESAIVLELTKALKTVRQRGNVPVLIMTPYVPAIFKCVSPMICEALSVVGGKVQEIGAELGVEVVGSYDGRQFDLTSEDFYDNAHLTVEAVQTLFGPGGKAWRPIVRASHS